MIKCSGAVLLLLVALVLAEPGVQQQQQQQQIIAVNGGPGRNHPYLFLSAPRGRAGAIVKGFEVIEEDDDEDDGVENDDDDSLVPIRRHNSFQPSDNDAEEDDDEDYQLHDDDVAVNGNSQFVIRNQISGGNKPNLQMIMRNAKPTHMMIPRENAGAIMVPDGIIEIEGQSVVDEKTGKAALLVPRSALDAIPDGSVVALMERSADETEEERANRVYVRRRTKGSRRNIKRRGGNRRRRVGSNKRRRVNKRNNIRVYQNAGSRRRRLKRGRRPAYIQG